MKQVTFLQKNVVFKRKIGFLIRETLLLQKQILMEKIYFNFDVVKVEVLSMVLSLQL